MPTPWSRVIERPHPGGHFVQLYDSDEAPLIANVSQYIGEGLRQGEGVLVIASQEHRQAFTRRLESEGADMARLLSNRQLVMWDARQALGEFMVGGQPDWPLFESTVRGAMRQVRPREGWAELRAYGEMVSLLWQARQFAAAIRLEQLWNKLLEQSAFSLYCAYAIDLFGKDCELANLDGILCTHTHLVPGRADGALETALYRSIHEILGTEPGELRLRMKSNDRPSWAVMPSAERIVLWLRKNLPEEAERILERAADYCRTLVTAE